MFPARAAAHDTGDSLHLYCRAQTSKCGFCCSTADGLQDLEECFATGLQDKASVYPAGLVFTNMVPPSYAVEERTQGAAFISV